MMKQLAIFALVLILSACASEPTKHYFNNINLDSEIRNSKGADCPVISTDHISRLLKIGVEVTDTEILNNYKLSGCTVNGSMQLNDQVQKFVFEYAGILFLEDGKALACGPACCASGFPYCSYIGR